MQEEANRISIDRITTDDSLQWVYAPDTATQTARYIPQGEYTFSDAAGWTYGRNYELTPEAFNELIDRINRVHPTTYWNEAGSTVTCSTAKVQEEEEFDTTEIEKYIDSLKKEVVGTEN